MTRRAAILLAAVAMLSSAPAPAWAQDVRVRDLVRDDQAAPLRLMGYGLVVGLDGTGDRITTGRSRGGVTVQSVVNLLQRFGITVPPEVLRTQNVAAVLVTAEVSPYLRVGARFETHVASLGDARSLRGGMLWVTPLVADPAGRSFASAQGALLTPEPSDAGAGVAVRWRPSSRLAANSATIPAGGVVELPLPKVESAPAQRILALRSPDRGTASRIAAAINAAMGPGTARVEDPGAIALTLKGSADEQEDALVKLQELRVRDDAAMAILVDARTGLVVAGGDATVQAATITVGDITLTIGLPVDSSAVPASPATPAPAQPAAADSVGVTAPSAQPPSPSPAIPARGLRLAAGVSVLRLTEALRAAGARGPDIGAALTALHQVGALAAEVTVR